MKNKIIIALEFIVLVAVAVGIGSNGLPFINDTFEQSGEEANTTQEEQHDPADIQVVLVEDENVQELISAVFAVSGDLSFETQMCVTHVLLNRVCSENYPDSLSEVISELNKEHVRETQFEDVDDLSEHAAILDDAQSTTEEAVHAAMSHRSNTIKLPEDVTIISIYELDRFDEWTSDCVDGLRFYFE